MPRWRPHRQQPPLPLPPPSPSMITYDTGLPSLPDDITCEIFGLLDAEALKSCSLAGKALSYSAKPFIHRTLYLTPRSRTPPDPVVPGPWNELNGLQDLGKRGLLQHARHISISLPDGNPLLAHDLQPHIQHLRTLTNLRSLKVCRLDTPSFIPKVEEYFGGFLGSLHSLELVSPRGYHDQILYFICQFPNLRDLRIDGVQVYTIFTNKGDTPSSLDINNSPPLDGTLDLKLETLPGSPWRDSLGAYIILKHLLKLPSGLKFRTLKLLRCGGNHPQLLVDACAPTLECVEFTGEGFNAPCPPLSFARHTAFRKFCIELADRRSAEGYIGWLTETLSTITSNAFAKVTICTPRGYIPSEDQVRRWNSVDTVLDRLNPREGVTLVVRPLHLAIEDNSMHLIGKCFPLMWKGGRVVLEVRAAS